MKKLIPILLSLLFVTLNVYSQEQEKKSESKMVEFLGKNGTFMQREFYELPSIGGSYNKIASQVLIVTDVTSPDKKMGCLRLETFYSSSVTSDSYIGTLDSDELDACIQCLQNIQNNIIKTSPTVYTEVEYSTRDGVELGAYWNSKKSTWIIYVKTKSYTARSMSTVDEEDLPLLITNLQSAKQLISEKTK